MTCLYIVGVCCGNSDVFAACKMVALFLFQGIGETGKVLAHKVSRLVKQVVGVVLVVVPIEESLPFFFENVEQLGLHAVERVETNENVFVAGKLHCGAILNDIAVEHSLVGKALFAQALLVACVYGVEDLPGFCEFLFYFTFGLGLEIGEELLHCAFLFLVENVGCGAHCAQVFDICKELRRVGEVLVDIVKVFYEHFAPVVEIVERVVAARVFHILLV